MKKIGCAFLVSLFLFVGSAVPSEADRGGWHSGGGQWHHGGGHVRLGFGIVAPPLWFGPPVWWGADPYAYAPPIAVPQAPPVFIQREAPQQSYWYYCQSPQGYYPYVQQCPGGWMTVVPQAP
jgi:hypothetical protein